MVDPSISDQKERIRLAAIELMNEYHTADKVTTRQIAERAGVAVGSINYHFQSKDNLLYEAYSQVFLAEVMHWLDDKQSGNEDPLTRLRGLFIQTARISLPNLEMARSSLLMDIQKGGMTTSLMILPLVRAIFKGTQDELTLRLKAATLMSTLQMILLKKEAFEAYMGINMEDPHQLDPLVDQIFDLVLFEHKKEK